MGLERSHKGKWTVDGNVLLKWRDILSCACIDRCTNHKVPGIAFEINRILTVTSESETKFNAHVIWLNDFIPKII